LTSTEPGASADGSLERTPAPAVSRALKILALLERAVGAAKSSTSNLCQVLENGQMITRTPSGYLLGVRTVQLGGAYVARFNQVREFYGYCTASPFLSHELVQVAILDGTDVLFLARHESRAPIRLSASIGSRFPAAPTAVGNALLTTLTDTEIAARFTGPQHFPPRTDHSVQTIDGLLSKVWVARDRGYAIDDNEVHPGVYGVAVVLPPWASGDPPLAMGASLMSAQASEEFVDSIVAELRRAAQQLSNPLIRRPTDGVPQDA
jgi:DNA-binding IclR family transcriptional regulator